MLKQKANDQKSVIGLYIHIPFCKKKCAYCDFLSGQSTKEERQCYVEALQQEIIFRAKQNKEKKVATIFFGGGTPTCLEAEDLGEILSTVFAHFQILPQAEISMEMNPGTVTKESLHFYYSQGINRLSIGLQSADNQELKLLGRIHTYEEFLVSYAQAREAGFTNINIDLMSGLPGQQLENFEKTLEQVLSLSPEHISAYSLIVEEGTEFFSRYQNFESEEQEEIDRAIYHLTKKRLKEKGYLRYEISNYAKKGYECRHNISYWTGIPYLGLGLGASSYEEKEEGKIRTRNQVKLKEYIKFWMQEEIELTKKSTYWDEWEALSKENEMEEFMFLGLRLMSGISIKEFEGRFGRTLNSVYPKVLEQLIEEKLLIQKNGQLALTDYGIDVSNYVLSEFLF